MADVHGDGGVGRTIHEVSNDEQPGAEVARQARGARTIDLTSRPSRDVANRLYQRLGFVARDTNVYRYSG